MKSEIVSDGARRRIDTKAVEKRRIELREELEKRYATELQQRGVIKRFLTKMKIRKLINQAIHKEYQQSLYNLNGRAKL